MNFSCVLLVSVLNSCVKGPNKYNFKQDDFIRGNIERIHSRGQHLYKFMGTKEIFYIRKESNSRRIWLKHQYGRRDVM